MNVTEVYDKALRVIDSCETREHALNARTYVYLFSKMFPDYNEMYDDLEDRQWNKLIEIQQRQYRH